MAEIPLRGRDGSVRAVAVVDDGDYEWLSRWRWCVLSRKHTWYAVRNEPIGRRPDGRVRQRTIYMHRQIMGEPSPLVDHRDNNGLNNLRSNLRLATNAQNMQNRSSTYGASGVRGAYPAKSGRWVAVVKMGGRAHHLGTYDAIEEAAAAASTFRATHMPFSRDYAENGVLA